MRTSARLPLGQGLSFQRVDAIDVRDVEDWLVAGRVWGPFYQHLV